MDTGSFQVQGTVELNLENMLLQEGHARATEGLPFSPHHLLCSDSLPPMCVLS